MIRSFQFVLLGIVLILVSGCQSETKNRVKTSSGERVCQGPEELVAMYCRNDFDGTFLGSEPIQSSEIDKIFVPTEASPPGWDMASIVEEFQVEPPQNIHSSDSEIQIKVVYKVLAELGFDVELGPKDSTENYVFHAKKINGMWKLMRPLDLRPHISVDSAVRHMKELMRNQADSTPESLQVLRKLGDLQVSTQEEAKEDSSDQQEEALPEQWQSPDGKYLITEKWTKDGDYANGCEAIFERVGWSNSFCFYVPARSFTIVWAPDSKHFAFNDAEASNSSKCYLFSTATWTKHDIQKALKRIKDKRYAATINYDKSYIKADHWKDARTVVIKAHGWAYMDAKRLTRDFEFEAEFSIKTHRLKITKPLAFGDIPWK